MTRLAPTGGEIRCAFCPCASKGPDQERPKSLSKQGIIMTVPGMGGNDYQLKLRKAETLAAAALVLADAHSCAPTDIGATNLAQL